MKSGSKKLSSIDIQRQLRHKNATMMDHDLNELGNESNAASVIEKIQAHPRLKSVVILQKNDLAS
ncbi:hypothetical protein DO021_09650 [Desulfobacter hydrogenophilus]|uniref:Uncharacterized protein n=1 Tax=Desulfobacter hydrogenophilus TaxID=2291 RepID=A0A328FEK0_9BACT|nr:hypothetical protein [Desulfobacter hydrogenophilus]NDY72192.1 hypothetical protein [Desulfobacter hydrogenophilus]QBH15126.1 hypothetical protein EYB58_20690 [Desulfobacter hydrogenophilus]RAM02200.1 hypothetical protein DO021_09650 [Desulfobacter hydrogenophilus]